MFLLGDALLVAPVVTAGATTRTVVLPPRRLDRSRDRRDRRPAMATRAITVPAPLDAIPTWQRAGTLVPTFAHAADTLLPSTAPG